MCAKLHKMQLFRPDELQAYLEGSDFVITGRHEEKHDSEFLQRNVTRRVSLPSDVDPKSIRCLMDQHGRLEVLAHRGSKSHGKADNAKHSLMINVFRNY